MISPGGKSRMSARYVPASPEICSSVRLLRQLPSIHAGRTESKRELLRRKMKQRTGMFTEMRA